MSGGGKSSASFSLTDTDSWAISTPSWSLNASRTAPPIWSSMTPLVIVFGVTDDGEVLQHADQAAQAEEGTTVLGDALTVEVADGLLPDPAVVNLRVRHLPALVSPDLPAHCAPGSTRHPSGTDVHTVVHILWTEPVVRRDANNTRG